MFVRNLIPSGWYLEDHTNPNIMTPERVRIKRCVRLSANLGKVKEIAAGKVKELSENKTDAENPELKIWSEILVGARHVSDAVRLSEPLPDHAWTWSGELQDVITCIEAGHEGDHAETLQAIVRKLDEVYQEAAQVAG